MLHRVRLAPVTIESYREVVPTEQIDELIRLGHRLRGLRVAHINATPYGGGRHPAPTPGWCTVGYKWGTPAELGYGSATSRENRNTPAGMASGGAWSATLRVAGSAPP
jgi:hypothetical protein